MCVCACFFFPSFFAFKAFLENPATLYVIQRYTEDLIKLLYRPLALTLRDHDVEEVLNFILQSGEGQMAALQRTVTIQDSR